MSSRSLSPDPKLPVAIKLLVWVQKQLAEKANFPRITNIVNATFEEPEEQQATASAS